MSVKNKIVFLGQREIPIGELKPHPDNPNRGSVPDIAESLRQFGQYRSVVATKDNTLLAGHHVVAAAKGLGMNTIRVDVIDTDEKTATKIMLADNRIPELGLGPDLQMLLADLEDFNGDIVGTGYTEDYVKLLTDAVLGPPGTSRGDAPPELETLPPSPGSGLRRLTLMIDDKLADHWDAHRKLFTDDGAALSYLLGGGS